MWGHRFDPTPHPDGRRREHFPCQDVCRKQGTDQLVPRAQLARNCALSGVDTGAWTSERLVKIRMGAPARYDLEGKSKTWKEPEEDPLSFRIVVASQFRRASPWISSRGCRTPG